MAKNDGDVAAGIEAGSRLGADPGIEGFHAALSRVFADQQKKALEFKMVFSEGVGQAASLIEQQNARIAELLRAHEELARQMAATEQQIAGYEATQTELDIKVKGLRERRDGLVDRNKKLEDERNSLREQVAQATERSEKAVEQNAALQGELDGLERKTDDLERETARLEKRRDKVRDDVARLTQLRDEYLAQLERFKEEKDDLTEA